MKRLTIILIILFILAANSAWSGTNTFTATSDNLWSTVGNWSLGHVPSSSEDVAVSPSTTSLVLDPGGYTTINNLNLTGTSGITFSGDNNLILQNGLTLDSNVTWSGVFVLIVRVGSVDTAGVSLAHTYRIEFGLWPNPSTISLASDLTCRQLNVYGQGTFTTNNHTITCTQFSDGFNNGNITFNLGSSTINVNGDTYFNHLTSLTVNSSGAHVNCTPGNDSVTYNFGSVNWGDAHITINTGTYNTTQTITGTNSLGTLSLAKTSGTPTVKFPASVTTTLGSFDANGFALTTSGTGPGPAATLSDTTGTNAVTNCTLSWLTVQGGATWNAFISGGNTDGGNNTGWAWTGVSPPSVTTQAAASPTTTTITGNGNITNNGGGTVDDYGFVWSATNTNPTHGGTNCTYVQAGTDNKSGAYSTSITGLTIGTGYYINACAHNSAGWGNGTATPFRTVGTFYVSFTGAATTIAAATGVEHPANYMNVTVHNAGPFYPGDTIYISDKGGTYKAAPASPCIVVPSSGADGNPIIYTAAPDESPKIDLSWLDDKTGWTETGVGTGIYTKGSFGFYARVAWEDGVALQKATSPENVGVNGDWYYSGGTFTYKPSRLTPANHDLVGIWYEGAGWDPYGFDLRERSNIEVSYLTLNGCSIGHGQNMYSSASFLLKNIKIHHNTIRYAPWGIWAQVGFNNCIEQDVEIYNNTIDYCNGGISTWTNSDQNTSHTQHPLRHNIHHNTITHLFSIDDTHDWIYAYIGQGTDPGIDHEGISFQDAVDCTVADNLISLSETVTRQYPIAYTVNGAITPRAIFFYLNPINVKTSGNKILRNRVQGRFYPAIYINGNPDPTNGGFENNIFAFNVLECSNTSLIYMATFIYGLNNTATGMNYWINNTINYAGGAGGEGNSALFFRYDDPGYWTFKNNIVVAPGAVNTFSNATTKNIFDHNNYYTTEETPFIYYTTGKIFATTWKDLGFDTVGSFSQDPVLNASTSVPTAGSPPAVKTGGAVIDYAALGITSVGIDGLLFSPTTPGMGASQYGGASPFTRIPLRGYTAP